MSAAHQVKATLAAEKHYFEMSFNEWAFAQAQGARYTILRVMCVTGTRLLYRIVLELRKRFQNRNNNENAG